MRIISPKRPWVATFAAASLAVGLLVPAAPAFAQETYPGGVPNILPTVSAAVPVYEPQLGRGEPLLAGQPKNIGLGADAASAHSALVRLSVFDAGQGAEVTVASAPALNVRQGHSASTAVLAPVINGQIAVLASADVNARIDVLAHFAGDPAAAGSTVALKDAVVRADTADALAAGGPGEGIGSTETSVGLIGLGGVPVDGVRAAHVTATVTAGSSATLILDGQRLPVAAGTTSISTVVTPSGDGDVRVRTEGASVQLRLHVRGYVAEAPENAAALNGAGSFWPTAGATSTNYTVKEAAAQQVPLEGVSGSQYVLALVEASATDNLTTVELGKPYRGRSKGAVVDPDSGAQPQLAVVPATDAALTLRRGTSIVSVLELGSFLGTGTGTATGTGSLAITSPAANSIDASGTFALTFDGTATPDGTAPLRIEVKLDGEPHGSAAVRPGNNGLGWSFTTSVKDPGSHTFEFVLAHRSGNTTSASWSGAVTLPGADDTVLTPETVVIGSEGHVSEVTAVVDNAVYFASDPQVIPGEIIVSAASAGAPNGFLRRVIAVDIVDGQWKLTTVAATLDEVFLQVDYEHTEQLGSSDLAGTSVEPVDPADAAEVTNVFFDVLTGDQVDLAPYPGEVLNPAGEAQEDAPLGSAAMGLGGGGSVGRSVPGILPLETEFEESISFKTGLTFKDEDQSPAAPGGDTEDSVAVELSGEAELGFALKVKLKSEVKWTQASLFPPKPSLPYPSVDEFSTVLESVAKATSKLSVAAEKSWSKEWEGPAKSIKFKPITFTIGIVPIVLTSDVGAEMKGEFSITGTATVAVSASIERKHELGIQYKDGKVSPINNGPETTGKPLALDSGTGLKGKIEATVGPELTYDSKLYGLAGPEIGFSIKVGSALTAEANLEKSTVEFELFLEGKMFLKAELTVPVIDKELLSVTLLEMTKKWSLKKTLFDAKDLFPNDPDPETPPVDEIDYGQDELTPATDAAAALDVEGAEVTSSFFVEGPPNPGSAGVFSQAAGGLPTTGKDYLVMSTGYAGYVFDASQGGGIFGVNSKRGNMILDATTLRIDLDVPANVNCLIGFDFRFYSDEYPQYVGSRYNDAFIVELDKSTWTVEGQDITAPRNFAFDELGNPVTINSAGPWTINEANAAGTSFNGATSLLRATTPVTPGKHSLFLSIFDMGDDQLDSAVLVDGIKFGSVENPATQCQQGVSAG
jgi:hypothetical protein